MDTNNRPSTNQQDHPHREGQTMNTTPQQQGTGQRVSTNNSQGMSDSEGQNPGRAQGQKDERDVQQDERQL